MKKDSEVLKRFDELTAHESDDGVVFINATDIVPEPIQWLWDGFLARGKLHLLAGMPGQGKSTIALSLAAIVSGGGRWPDGSHCESGNVLIWSAEDDIRDTIVPRLLAAGDKSKCWFIQGTKKSGVVHPFDPEKDLMAIEKKALEIGGIDMLILDPVVTVISGDSHKNVEVRKSLQPVVDLAGKLNAAVIGITHFAKGGNDTNPMMRVIGSVAFTALSRVVFAAQKRADEDKGVLVRVKSNISSDKGGFEYSFENVSIVEGITASRIVWGNRVDETAAELFGAVDKTSNQLDDALRQILEEGPAPAGEIFDQLDRCGYSQTAVRRASKRLGVETKKDGMSGGWTWSLKK